MLSITKDSDVTRAKMEMHYKCENYNYYEFAEHMHYIYFPPKISSYKRGIDCMSLLLLYEY